MRFITNSRRGEGDGAQYPGRRITGGAPKSPNNVTSTSFITAPLLPKDLYRSKHGGANFFLAPGAIQLRCAPECGNWLVISKAVLTVKKKESLR